MKSKRSICPSLVWLLVVGALGELVFNRLGVRMFGLPPLSGLGAPTTTGIEAQASGEWLGIALGVVDWLGLFFLSFTSILAFLLCAWALVVLIRDTKLFDVPSRVALGVVATLFMPLAGLGLFWQLSPVLVPYLHGTFGGVTLVLAIAFVRRTAPWRAKAGVAYIAGIMSLHSYWLYREALTAIASNAHKSSVPTHEQFLTSYLVVAGAAVAYVSFSALCCRRRSLFTIGSLLTSAVVTIAVAILLQVDYVWSDLVARYGLGLVLPAPNSLLLHVYVAALLPFTLLLLGLFKQAGASRAVGLGLVLLVLAGADLRHGNQILLALVGLIQLIRGLMAPADGASSNVLAVPVPDASQWKTFLHQLVDREGGPSVESRAPDGQQQLAEAVVLQQPGSQVARVCGWQAGVPYAVRLLTKGSRLEELEIDIGHPPKDDTPVALVRRRGLRGRRVTLGRGLRGKDFEGDFMLRDDTGEFGDLLAPLVGELRANVHGWLAIWPAEGIRYLARPETSGWPVPLVQVVAGPSQVDTEALVALVDLLHRVAGAAGIPNSQRPL